MAEEALSGAAPQAAKVDLVSRFLAVAIDGAIAVGIGFVPVIGGLIGAAYMCARDGLNIDALEKRSIGKKAMGLRVVFLKDGTEATDLATSIRRNFPLAIGPLIMVVPAIGYMLGLLVAMAIGVIEGILVLADARGRRLGDQIADTVVIQV